MRYRKISLSIVILTMGFGCGKKEPTGGEDLALGTVKCEVSSDYTANPEYSNCKLKMGVHERGGITCLRMQDEIDFEIMGNSDPDDMESFPVTLTIGPNDNVNAYFYRYGSDTLRYATARGSFVINGRRDDHSIYGTFGFEATRLDTTKKITVTDGEFNVPRTY